MRRKLAYILLNLGLLVGVGATVGTALTKMDADVNYASGRELYFRLSKPDTTYEGLDESNYLGNNAETQNTKIIDSVATEMEKRLETWGVDASVSKEGFDLIKVNLRVEGDNETEYGYLENYLSFSGGDITVAAGADNEDTQKNAPTGTEYQKNAMFEGQTAKIEYINGSVPVVTIPVNYSGESGKLGELIKYCEENTKDADTSAGTEAKNCYLVLWANMQEGDSFITATSTDENVKDSNMAKRLIFGENASNAWYTDSSDSDNNYKKLQLVPNSDAIKDGSYDASKAGAAYKAAFYYMNLLNASSYQDDFSCDVTFLYAHKSAAAVDPLLSAGDWHLNPAFGATMIASLVGLACLALVSALLYRVGALSILSNVGVALLGAFWLFAYFNAAFGIGAVAGFMLGGLVTAFGSIYYFAKFKEQLYEGRSPKKAHQEAIKKALWPTVDAGVIAILLGLCVYGFVPSVIGAMGLALLLTAFFGTISNLLLLRAEGYLLAFDNGTERSLAALYGVDTARIPDALKEEKQSYFGPYAKTDFLKHKRIFVPLVGALLLASGIGLGVFAGLGEAYNYSGAYDDSTSIALEYRVEEGGNAPSFSKVEDIETNFLPLIQYNGKTLAEYVKTDGIYVEESKVYVTEAGEEATWNVYNFHIDLSAYFDLDKSYAFEYESNEGHQSEETTLGNVITSVAELKEMYSASANNVVVQAGTPAIGTIYLALGVASVLTLVYSFLRYRPSRAILAAASPLAAALFVTGFLSLSRLAVTPLASIGAIFAFGFASLLVSFLYNKEKELRKESREHEKDSAAFRDQCLVRATSESAGESVAFSILGFGVLLSFFAFAPALYRPIFLAAIVGLLFALLLILTAVSPLTLWLSKGLRAIRQNIEESRKNRTPKNPNGGNTPSTRRKEPEEAIFIGIND